MTLHLFVDKVSHCTLELQIEPGAVDGDDEVRLSGWTTSFAEVEDDGVRASAWMSNYVCFLFEHVESYLDVSDLRYSSSGLNAHLFLKVVLSVSTRRLRRCGVPRAVCCGSGEFWARCNFGIRIITVVLHIADARHIPSCIVVQCVRMVSWLGECPSYPSAKSVRLDVWSDGMD